MPVNSIQGPKHWDKKSTQVSLAEAAGTCASAALSAAENGGEQSTAFDFVSSPVQPQSGRCKVLAPLTSAVVAVKVIDMLGEECVIRLSV